MTGISFENPGRSIQPLWRRNFGTGVCLCAESKQRCIQVYSGAEMALLLGLNRDGGPRVFSGDPGIAESGDGFKSVSPIGTLCVTIRVRLRWRQN